jgi:hypothetical protein
MEKRYQQKDSLVVQKDCGAVSLVSTSSDSVDEAESALERQEVKVRKGRKLKRLL